MGPITLVPSTRKSMDFQRIRVKTITIGLQPYIKMPIKSNAPRLELKLSHCSKYEPKLFIQNVDIFKYELKLFNLNDYAFKHELKLLIQNKWWWSSARLNYSHKINEASKYEFKLLIKKMMLLSVSLNCKSKTKLNYVMTWFLKNERT